MPKENDLEGAQDQGGKHGGIVVAQGTPEDIANCDRSYTGRYLRQVLSTKRQRAA